MSELLALVQLAEEAPIITAVIAVVILARAVVILTPTPKDNRWARKAYRVIEWVALEIGKAKDRSTHNG